MKVTVTEKKATGKGDIAGTKLVCECGWIATTSLDSEVASLMAEHDRYHAAKGEFRVGDMVRENRMGSLVERVLRVCDTTLYTDRSILHTSKAVRVSK